MVRGLGSTLACLLLLAGVAVAKPETVPKNNAASPEAPAAKKPRPKLDPVKDFILEFRFALNPAPEEEEPQRTGRSFRSAIRRPAPRPVIRPSEIDLKAIATVLEERIPILSLEPGEVEVNSPEDLRVRVPYARIPPGAVRQFSRAGQLEVRWLEDINTSLNPDGRYYLDTLNVNGDARLRFRDRRTDKIIAARDFATQCPLLAKTEDLEPDSARRVGGGVRMGVRVQLNERATRRIRDFQKKPGRMAAVFLDGQLLSLNAVTQKYQAPKRRRGEPRDESLDEIDIMAGFGTEEEAGYLANVLNSGALPYPLKLISQGLMGNKTPPPDDEEESLPDPAGT